MAIFFNTKFEGRDTDADNGNIVITALNEGVATQEWEVRIAIIGPTGAIFRAKPVAADAVIDEDVATEVDVLTVAIPTDTDGVNYQAGTYTIRYYITGIAGPTIGSEILYEYEYTVAPVTTVSNNASSLVSLSTLLNCLNGELTATDGTDYTGWTRVSRTLSIVHPTIPGIATPATDTTTDESLTVTATHINVTYQATLEVVVSRATEGVDLGGSHTLDIYQYWSINLYEDVDIDCDNDLCDTLSCLEQKFTLLNAQACSRGGWSQLTPAERANFEYNMVLLQLARLFLDCGNGAKFRTYIAMAKANLDCDCGCGDNSTTVSPLITIGGTESTAILE